MYIRVARFEIENENLASLLETSVRDICEYLQRVFVSCWLEVGYVFMLSCVPVRPKETAFHVYGQKGGTQMKW